MGIASSVASAGRQGERGGGLRTGRQALGWRAMNEEPLPDLSRDPAPPPERTNHLAYILLALIIMLIFWYAG